MAKKTPKAESVITPEVLRKYAKEIKQAKLEEFRSFFKLYCDEVSRPKKA